MSIIDFDFLQKPLKFLGFYRQSVVSAKHKTYNKPYQKAKKFKIGR